MDESKTNCKRCNKATLTRQQFINELADKHSIKVDYNTLNPILSGVFVGGYNSFEAKKNQILATYKDIEKKRAFKCISCGEVYCMDCLFRFAPSHANGGKACFSCNGTFTEI
jgi:hypothetical protein